MSKEKASFARKILDWFKEQDEKEKSENKFNANLADGTPIMYEGDLAQGTIVKIKATGEDGTETEMLAPPGEHMLGGDMEGKVMVIEEGTGKVLEIKDAVAASDDSTNDQLMEQAVEKMMGQFTSMKKEIVDANKKIEELAKQVIAGKVEKEKFTYKGNTTKKYF